MQIYFADLSHDTVGLATEVFPLNVGFVAAYAKQEFGDDTIKGNYGRSLAGLIWDNVSIGMPKLFT